MKHWYFSDDTEFIDSDSLYRLCALASLPHVGAVGAKLFFPDTTNIQHCGIVNLYNGPSHAYYGYDDVLVNEYYLRRSAIYNWIAVTGACLSIKSSDFKSVNGFDENLGIAYNDISLCYSLEHGIQSCKSFVNAYSSRIYIQGVDHLDSRKSRRLQ